MMPMLSEKILPPVSWIWCWIQIKGLALFRQTQTLNICTKMTAMFFRHLINAWLHFMKIIIRHNNKSPLTKEILNQSFFFNLKPISNLSLVILITSTFSHPILSPINVLQLETFVNFSNKVSSLPGLLFQHFQNLYIFISRRYLIPNYWK